MSFFRGRRGSGRKSSDNSKEPAKSSRQIKEEKNARIRAETLTMLTNKNIFQGDRIKFIRGNHRQCNYGIFDSLVNSMVNCTCDDCGPIRVDASSIGVIPNEELYFPKKSMVKRRQEDERRMRQKFVPSGRVDDFPMAPSVNVREEETVTNRGRSTTAVYATAETVPSDTTLPISAKTTKEVGVTADAPHEKERRVIHDVLVAEYCSSDEDYVKEIQCVAKQMADIMRDFPKRKFSVLSDLLKEVASLIEGSNGTEV